MSFTANDNSTSGASNDQVQPFQLSASNFRGRIVRLGDVADDILSAHNYPDKVAKILAEAMALTTLLAEMLKFDGIFTLQIKGEKAIKALVCDMTNKGDIRAYAGFDPEQLAAIPDKPNMSDMFGEGYLAFTVDQGGEYDRYQGIVELHDGENLVNSINHYFMQSEQINTTIRVAADKVNDKWVVGAIMLQKLPEEGRLQLVENDDWQREKVLLQSCRDEELLDVNLPIHDLLYRLFHEEGITVFSPLQVKKHCRCSQERVENILKSLSQEELDEFIVDGEVEMKCEFCSKSYMFSEAAIKKLVQSD